MKKGLLAILLMLNLTVWATEQKSRLLVGITISHFYPEWFSIYENELSEHGFKRLMKHGAKMMADYHYAYSQTGVDHATIYTGMLPSEHGIVNHLWYDRLRNRRKSNVLDTENTPKELATLSLGSAMKMKSIASKVYSIGANGEEAVLSGGTTADMAFWLSENTGKWESSTYYANSLPTWAVNYNYEMDNDSLIKKGWIALENEKGNRTTMRLKNFVGLNSQFYYDLAQAKRRYNTYRILKATPFINSLITNFAVKLIQEEQLGKDVDADLLALNFSCLDYMNRDFGIYDREFLDVVVRLDRDLERLFAELDRQVGVDNYTVFLTFSETRELLPNDWHKLRISADYFSMHKAVALLKSFLNLVYGEGEWVVDYDATQIYLDRVLIEKNKISLQEMQNKVAGFLIDFEGVARVLTANSLTHNNFSEGVDRLVQNSFSQKRSGDVLVVLQPTWVSVLDDYQDHHARYSKRNKVPLYLYGAGIPNIIPQEGPMTSLVPLLCDVLQIPIPYTIVK